MRILREIDNAEQEKESLEHKYLRKKCVIFVKKKLRDKIKTFEDYQIMLEQMVQFVEEQVLAYLWQYFFKVFLSFKTKRLHKR